MQRAVIYTRASLDRTGLRAAVDRQEEAGRGLCQARGWQVVEVVCDNSVSASTGRDRPGWQRVLALIEAHEVDVVVAWHVDRMMRTMVDLEQLIVLAERHGVGIATAVGDIDLTTDAGRMVARILAAVARAEVERKAARQQAANAQRAARGAPSTGGARPFGYTRDHMSILPDEADAVRDGAQLALAGASMRSIARRWSAAGLVSSRTTDTASKGGWSGRGVRGVLVNPRYAGIRVYRGAVVGTGTWPAILDEETHLALRAKLLDPSRTLGTVRSGRTASNLLTGIARCSVCAGTLSATSIRGTPRYTCRPSGHIAAPRAALDEWVGALIVTRLAQPDALELLTPTGDVDVDAARVEAEALRRRLDVLAESFALGAITQAQLTTGTAKLRGLLEAAEATMAKTGAGTLLASVLGVADTAARWAGLPLEHRRGIVGALVDVEVDPVGPGRAAGFDPRLHARVTFVGKAG